MWCPDSRAVQGATCPPNTNLTPAALQVPHGDEVLIQLYPPTMYSYMATKAKFHMPQNGGKQTQTQMVLIHLQGQFHLTTICKLSHLSLIRITVITITNYRLTMCQNLTYTTRHLMTRHLVCLLQKCLRRQWQTTHWYPHAGCISAHWKFSNPLRSPHFAEKYSKWT